MKKYERININMVILHLDCFIVSYDGYLDSLQITVCYQNMGAISRIKNYQRENYFSLLLLLYLYKTTDLLS